MCHLEWGVNSSEQEIADLKEEWEQTRKSPKLLNKSAARFKAACRDSLRQVGKDVPTWSPEFA